ATRTTLISTLSLHDALPIYPQPVEEQQDARVPVTGSLESADAHVRVVAVVGDVEARQRLEHIGERAIAVLPDVGRGDDADEGRKDRKSTRLNSSHSQISYAV